MWGGHAESARQIARGPQASFVYRSIQAREWMDMKRKGEKMIAGNGDEGIGRNRSVTEDVTSKLHKNRSRRDQCSPEHRGS